MAISSRSSEDRRPAISRSVSGSIRIDALPIAQAGQVAAHQVELALLDAAQAGDHQRDLAQAEAHHAKPEEEGRHEAGPDVRAELSGAEPAPGEEAGQADRERQE